MRIHLCIALIAICLFGACRKKKEFGPRYPEDIDDTYLSAADRLCDKWWVLDSAAINNTEYTDSVYNLLGEYKFYINSAEQKSPNGHRYREGWINTQSIYGKRSIIQTFANNSKEVFFNTKSFIFSTDTFACCTPIFCFLYSATWEIRKLSQTELKIQFQRGDSLFVNYYK